MRSPHSNASVPRAVRLRLPARLRLQLEPLGQMYSMAGRSTVYLVQDLVRGTFEWREFVKRSWFLANTTVLPVILVSAPLGMAIVMQVGGLASQLGADSYVGAVGAIGVLREAAPIVTALLLAGVGGAAVCAELGARTIREELDALEVMGINPLRRIVAPLMLASLVVALLLNFLVIFVSIAAGYYFDVLALNGSSGSFWGSFSMFATSQDLITSEIKAGAFGLTAGVIAAYNGMSARKGPAAVGEAVNRSVVISGVALFALNLIITQVALALFPARTF